MNSQIRESKKYGGPIGSANLLLRSKTFTDYHPDGASASDARRHSACLVIAAILVCGGGAPQAGLLTVFLVVELVPVLQGGKPCLDLVELRTRDRVFLFRGQDRCDLLLRFFDSVRRLRMSRECLGYRA